MEMVFIVTGQMTGGVIPTMHFCLQVSVWADTEPRAVPQTKPPDEVKFSFKVNRAIRVPFRSSWENGWLHSHRDSLNTFISEPRKAPTLCPFPPASLVCWFFSVPTTTLPPPAPTLPGSAATQRGSLLSASPAAVCPIHSWQDNLPRTLFSSSYSPAEEPTIALDYLCPPTSILL